MATARKVTPSNDPVECEDLISFGGHVNRPPKNGMYASKECHACLQKSGMYGSKEVEPVEPVETEETVETIETSWG